MIGRPKTPLILSKTERDQLIALAMDGESTQALALRARIVLLCATGIENNKVAARERVTSQTVSKWRARFVEQRLDGLLDAPRLGAPRTIDDMHVNALIAKTLEPLPEGAMRWSTRSMAREMNLSQATVSRIWRAFGLQSHQQQTADDQLSIETVRDIVGLYLDSLIAAIVLCVDDSRPIEALDGKQSVLPSASELPESDGHERVRRGTTKLFASLDLSLKEMLGKSPQRHRGSAFLKFLSSIDDNVPLQFDIHLIVHERRVRKTPIIKAWFGCHPRVHVHYVPTFALWLSQAERLTTALIKLYIRYGTYRSTQQFEQAIRFSIGIGKFVSIPFVWFKSADDIVACTNRLYLKIRKVKGSTS